MSMTIRSRLRTFVAACAAVLAAGCASYTPVPLTGCDHPSGICDQIRASAVATYRYAQLAANAYMDEAASFTLPGGYVLARSVPNDDVGFAANVYERRSAGSLQEVILAFRGTENHDARDWIHGNIGRQQATRARALYEETRSRYPGVPVSVTGHSLGGALATQLSLEDPKLDTYVFNTSPRFRATQTPHDNTRHSVVEAGEVNKVLRIFGREPTQLYTSIDCSKGGPLGQHAQVRLAACLTRIAALESHEARESLEANKLQPWSR